VAERLSFDIMPIADQLARLPEVDLKTGEMIAPYTSYQIGGPAAIWASPRSETGIGQVLAITHKAGIPLFILGRGSNLLVSDKGWPGIMLYLGDNISGWRFAGNEAAVLAGTPLIDLIRAAVDQGLGGMELMAGIPGGIGGALRMNAGAFGQEIQQTTIEIKGFRLDGTSFRARREEINFGYRHVPDLDPVVITSGRFRFKKAAAGMLKSRMDDILALRDVTSLGILRELHRWGAHAMVITVMLHMLRVFLTGSYKPPREFNWGVGVVLLVLTFLLSFTGYLLPWDQLAIWAITVGTNMARATPFVGSEGPGSALFMIGDVPLITAGSDVRFALLGGKSVGAAALMRFYVLHCVAIPLVAAVLMGVHFWRIRKDGGISGPL